MLFLKSSAGFRSHVLLYALLITFQWSVYGKKIGVIRQSPSFSAVNFDRIRGYALVNATYLVIENLALMKCISTCQRSKRCVSLNHKKKSNGEITCELNEYDRHSSPELAFEKQSQSEHYEIQTPCKKHSCYNGGRCNFNQVDNTHQCRCPLEFTGEHCEKRNAHHDKFYKSRGIFDGKVFMIGPNLNYAQAKTACSSFGARLASRDELEQLALKGYTSCRPGWTESGKSGYFEHFGSCHRSTGSTHTGYFSYNCCADKETNFADAWCIKQNIDYCMPGWYAYGKYCWTMRDDQKVKWAEAEGECAKLGATFYVAKGQADRDFMSSVCPSCSPVHSAMKKIDGTWTALDGVTPIQCNIWAAGEPNSLYDCAEWNPEAKGIKTIPCDAERGIMCLKTMF